MKNILLIMPYGSVGGMERLALYMYDFYKSEGFNVKAIKIIKLQSDIINFRDDEYALSTIDFNEMSFSKRFFFYIKIPFLIRKIIKQNKSNYSIAFGDMANVFSSLTFTDEYKIASIHALKSVEFTNKNFLNKVFKIGFKTCYYNLDKVVCISEAIKKDLIEKCGFRFKKKLQVIYNPHDIAKMQEMSSFPIESIEESKIFEKDVVIFLGRLSMQKSPWHLIKAFSLLLKEKPETHLVFIGDGELEVEKYIKDLIEYLQIGEKVFFLGRKSNPYQYLKQSKALALSSYYEGTPNVIVESIACEIPIVSSNCTKGIQEIMCVNKMIRNDNLFETESGIITPNFFKGSLSFPEDNLFTKEEEEFAKALKIVISDKNFEKNLKKYKEELLSKFDINLITARYLNIS